MKTLKFKILYFLYKYSSKELCNFKNEFNRAEMEQFSSANTFKVEPQTIREMAPSTIEGLEKALLELEKQIQFKETGINNALEELKERKRVFEIILNSKKKALESITFLPKDENEWK